MTLTQNEWVVDGLAAGQIFRHVGGRAVESTGGLAYGYRVGR